MVDVAQLVEPRIVIPAVAGSSPVVHPTRHLPGRTWRLELFCARARVGRAKGERAGQGSRDRRTMWKLMLMLNSKNQGR